MKISEVKAADVIGYIRIPDGEDEQTLISGIMAAALAYIRDYTGLTDAEIDRHEDLTMAYLLLCQELYDHRSTGEESAAVNRTMDTILGMHVRNLV